ncbi:MAG: hypothetical protein E7030_09115 [Akkermansiaceae bacterium]|nr:hypothetical protein [Akkermansiaceae bacterium]
MKHGILAAILLPLNFTSCDDSTQHAAPAPKAESSASGQTSPPPSGILLRGGTQQTATRL